jgi:hypothetical protein
MPNATALERIPRAAYSMARDLVTALRPPLVSEASAEVTWELAGNGGRGGQAVSGRTVTVAWSALGKPARIDMNTTVLQAVSPNRHRSK